MPTVEPEHHEVAMAAYYCHKRGGERHGHALMDWIQGEQLVFMEKNYAVLGKHRLQGDKKEKLWNSKPRTCRYCGSTKPADRGWKEAHALPEAIGNKTIIAMDECTDCNEHFAQFIEDDFGKLLQLAKSITRIPGKRGVPTFKARGGKSRIDVTADQLNVQQYDSDPLAQFDPVTNTLSLSADSKPLVPLAVYKCLTKMAISIMPPEYLPNFQHTVTWLKKPNHEEWAADIASSAKCALLFQPGPMRPDGSWCLLLGRRKPDALIPDTIFVLTIANHSFQIMLPCSPGNNHLVDHKVPLPLFPSYYGFGYEFGELSTTWHNLGSPHKQTIRLSGSLSCDSAVKS